MSSLLSAIQDQIEICKRNSLYANTQLNGTEFLIRLQLPASSRPAGRGEDVWFEVHRRLAIAGATFRGLYVEVGFIQTSYT